MRKTFTLWIFMTSIFVAQGQNFFELKTFEENGKYGLSDNNGKKLTPAKYDRFTPTFYEGLCSISFNYDAGFINGKGKEVVPFIYDDVHDFTPDGLAAVMKSHKWGFINKKGKEVIPLTYQKVFDFKKGKAFVIGDTHAHFINLKGEEQDPKYKLEGKYNEDYINTIKNYVGQTGFLRGQTVLPNFYDQLTFYKNSDFIMVTNRKKIGFIKFDGEEIIPPIYDEFNGVDDKYFSLRKNHKTGVIDFNGKIISPFIYDSIKPFSEGLAVVKLDVVFVPDPKVKTDEHYGFIDETGKEVIPRTFDYAESFRDGKAKVRLGNENFYINKKGERID